MNVRKTLVLLGLTTLGHEALAGAQVASEQRLQVGSVELSIGAGLLNGKSEEKVYDLHEGGGKLSQLNWDFKQVPTLHLGLAYHPADWLTLDVRGWTRMNAGASHMKDYDWLDGEGAGWTHRSDHPDTRLKNAWQAELAATVWALKREDLALGVMAGYQRSQFDWQSRGGSYVYSSDDGYRDLAGQFSAGQKVISYQQTYATPYVGLVGLYGLRNWTLEGRFKYSQWVQARSYDNHYLRDLTFTGNHGNTGQMQSLALALSYHVSPKFSVKAGIDHQVYAETRGSTLIRHAPSGQSGRTGHNSSGQANRTTMSTLAVAYQF
ncbi:omptin family outer membrane protease [Pseudomonas sp. DWP3-1-2]|uniref:omptin family outer membrane protease n=1 Tax=Pseudomonas sp. DWP3-1-2 TaxID=2804645 RepID=UPI003CEB6A20